MQTTNDNPIFSDEEIKSYLKEFFKVFCKLIMVSVLTEMKDHNIRHLQDYITLLVLQYYAERNSREKDTITEFSKN